MFIEHPGVFTRVRKRGTRSSGILEQQQAAINRLIQPLVQVHGEGVSLTQTAEFLRDGEGGRHAVGSIDMEPYSLIAADLRYRPYGVDGAHAHRASGCDNRNRRSAGGAVLSDR